MFRTALVITRRAHIVVSQQKKLLSSRSYRYFSSEKPTPQTNDKEPKKDDKKGDKKENSNTRGPVTYFSLAITSLVGLGIYIYYNIEKQNREEKVTSQIVKQSGIPALGGPWSLIDKNGLPQNSAMYKGKYTLLYFGFTHCPDICPSELVKVGKIVDELGMARIMFII